MRYHRPSELSEALALLADGPKTILAGGTDLYPATDRPELSGDIMDLSGLAALRGVSFDGQVYRIGAATTWSDILKADLPPACDALKLSAREVGSIQIQNAGTLGGNLCNASPAADGVPPLLVLNAEVELTGANGVRRMGLSQFITGNRRTKLAPGEVLSAVLIPVASMSGASHFQKLGARKYLVISIAMVAVRVVVEDGRIQEAAVAVGSCSEVAKRLDAVEAALIGQSVGDVNVSDDLVAPALSPIADIRADAAYRLTVAAELVRRTIRGALK